MKKTAHLVFASISALVLTACGGGKSASDDANLILARGQLTGNTPTRMQSLTATDFKFLLSADVIQSTGSPICGVELNYLKYTTVGGMGEVTDASAALMVPTGSDARCIGPRPIVLYAHGTVAEKKYNLANWTDRTNPAFQESFFIAASFAAQGYIVVAPNYAGYDSSSLDYHPYMNADQQSKEMMDALAAAKAALPKLLSPASASNKLFLTGYSQGGSVTMATHRALEAANIPVTASAPQSGVYLLLAQMDAVFLGKVIDGAPLFGSMLINSAQRSFGNLYKQPSEIFEDAYAAEIEKLLPGNFSYSDLIASGKLPRALFSSTAPAGLGDLTPAKGDGAFDTLYAAGFGSPNLLKNSVRASYVEDARARPDGALGTTPNYQLPAAPTHPFRIMGKAFDLRSWTPKAPMLLCGGKGDAMAIYNLNTAAMKAIWKDLGAQITELDLDSDPSSTNDPFALIKQSFAQRKAAVYLTSFEESKRMGRTDAEAQIAANSYVRSIYHPLLVPGFCGAAVNAYFKRF
jgi:hypothetical protein